MNFSSRLLSMEKSEKADVCKQKQHILKKKIYTEIRVLVS